MKKVLVVQPYIAGYRTEFWKRTIAEGLRRGITIDLAAGAPTGAQAARQDEASGVAVQHVSTRSLRLMSGPSLRWQSSWRLWKDYDGLILEASGSLLDTSFALMTRKRVGLWGHIDSFTGPQNALDRLIETRQLRSADAVLAYTPRGGAAAQKRGVPSDRISVLFNTIDTTNLTRLVDDMTKSRAEELLGLEAWSRDATLCYLGGLDASKRVRFLADALDLIWHERPEVRVLVAGTGEEVWRLQQACERGQVRLLGHADDESKAALSVVASAIVMPGRVGLVAVDSFCLGLPIVTTDWPFHAPEFEYLTHEADCIVTDNDVPSYVRGILDLLGDHVSREALSQNLRSKRGWPPLSGMASRFVDACERVLAD